MLSFHRCYFLQTIQTTRFVSEINQTGFESMYLSPQKAYYLLFDGNYFLFQMRTFKLLRHDKAE